MLEGATSSSPEFCSFCAASDRSSSMSHLTATEASTTIPATITRLSDDFRRIARDRADALTNAIGFGPNFFFCSERLEFFVERLACRLRKRLALRFGRPAHSVEDLGINSANEQVRHD